MYLFTAQVYHIHAGARAEQQQFSNPFGGKFFLQHIEMISSFPHKARNDCISANFPDHIVVFVSMWKPFFA